MHGERAGGRRAAAAETRRTRRRQAGRGLGVPRTGCTRCTLASRDARKRGVAGGREKGQTRVSWRRTAERQQGADDSAFPFRATRLSLALFTGAMVKSTAQCTPIAKFPVTLLTPPGNPSFPRASAHTPCRRTPLDGQALLSYHCACQRERNALLLLPLCEVRDEERERRVDAALLEVRLKLGLHALVEVVKLRARTTTRQ